MEHKSILSITTILLEPIPLYYYSQHHWYYTMDYKKAMKILRQAEHIEKKLANRTEVFQYYLNSYKENYWKQISIDRNILFRIYQYMSIFYFSRGLFTGLVVLLLAGMVVIISLLKRKAQAPIQNLSSRCLFC